jgi:nucleoside diphosphate kinase
VPILTKMVGKEPTFHFKSVFHNIGFRFRSSKRLVPQFNSCANFNKNGSNKPIEEHNLETMVSTLIITNVGKFTFFMNLQF